MIGKMRRSIFRTSCRSSSGVAKGGVLEDFFPTEFFSSSMIDGKRLGSTNFTYGDYGVGITGRRKLSRVGSSADATMARVLFQSRVVRGKR